MNDAGRAALGLAMRAGSKAGFIKIIPVLAVVLLLAVVILGPIMAVGVTNANGQPEGEPSTGTGTGVPSGNAQEMAQRIMASVDSGELRFENRLHQNQVAAYADGASISEKCTLDPRIFQVIILVLDEYDQVTISSLNRRCTSDHAGVGEASMHWQGRAIDFSAINNSGLNGSNQYSVAIARLFDRVAPADAGIGQANCRGWGQLSPGRREFKDGCNHQHLELGWSNDPLKP